MNYKILFFVFPLLLNNIFAQTQQADTLKKKNHFELSFGQSLLFISNTRQATIFNNAAIVVPTSAILFLSEFRPDKKMRIPVFINIATETKQYLVNGQLVYEKASPTIGTGVQFKLFQIKINDDSKLEMEIGPLASFIFDKKDQIRVAPIIAGRFKVYRGTNFVMYFGCSYSFGIGAFGILYGTGTVF